MKAHWTEADFSGMQRTPLPFTAEDVRLITTVWPHGPRLRGLNSASRDLVARLGAAFRFGLGDSGTWQGEVGGRFFRGCNLYELVLI